MWDHLYIDAKHRRHVEVAVRDFGKKHSKTGHFPENTTLSFQITFVHQVTVLKILSVHGVDTCKGDLWSKSLCGKQEEHCKWYQTRMPINKNRKNEMWRKKK